MKLTTKERFWSKVNKTDYCWEWVGAKYRKGYGNFWDGKRYIPAHRYSWILANGAFIESLHVLHKCDNTGCVNPVHLFLGTNKDNIQDAINKGRRIANKLFEKGENNIKAKLTKEQIKEIREKWASKKYKQKDLVKEYGITKQHVYNITHNIRWKEI